MMYVVRRAFKSAGVCYKPGDVIDDITRVKRIKSKLGFNKIVIVTEQNFEAMAEFFKAKFGVDLPKFADADADAGTAADAIKTADVKARPAKVQVQPAKVVAGKIRV